MEGEEECVGMGGVYCPALDGGKGRGKEEWGWGEGPCDIQVV